MRSLPNRQHLHNPYELPSLHPPLEPGNPRFIAQASLLCKTHVPPIDLKTSRPPSLQSKQGKPRSAITSNILPRKSPHQSNPLHLSLYVPSAISTSETSIGTGAIGSYISMIILWQACTMICGFKSMRQARSVGRLCMGCRGTSIAGD